MVPVSKIYNIYTIKEKRTKQQRTKKLSLEHLPLQGWPSGHSESHQAYMDNKSKIWFVQNNINESLKKNTDTY